jgi:hypothetical protein
VVAERLAHVVCVHLEQGPVLRAAGRHQDVVDRCWQVLKEPLRGSRVGGVEGCGALRADLQRRLLEPVGIAAGEDYIGALSPGAPGCLEPDARAAADQDDSLSC